MKKTTGRNWGAALKSAIKGAAVSLIGAVIMCALAAVCIIRGVFSEEWTGYIAAAILLISSYLGIKINTRTISENGYTVCVFTGAVFLLMLLSLNIVMTGGSYRGLPSGSLTVLAGMTLGGIRMRRKGRGRVSVKRR